VSARWNDAREDAIEALDPDALDLGALRERLKAAEELAVLFGWCPARGRESVRDGLAQEAWRRWYDLVGTEDGGPQHNKRIDDMVRHAEGRS
jgi:hypothetical protein